MALTSFEIHAALNFLRRLTPARRRADLRQVLDAMPDEWLYEADEVLSELLRAREAKAAFQTFLRVQAPR